MKDGVIALSGKVNKDFIEKLWHTAVYAKMAQTRWILMVRVLLIHNGIHYPRSSVTDRSPCRIGFEL